MFSLTIVFGPGPMVWTLMYKTEEAADAALSAIKYALEIRGTDVSFSPAKTITVDDDFGQHADIMICDIHGVMLENLEQSKLAHIERALHQSRTKVKADEMVRADPVLRTALQGGSGILQPAMPANGGWRG
jgi:hypothetical protein